MPIAALEAAIPAFRFSTPGETLKHGSRALPGVAQGTVVVRPAYSVYACGRETTGPHRGRGRATRHAVRGAREVRLPGARRAGDARRGRSGHERPGDRAARDVRTSRSWPRAPTATASASTRPSASTAGSLPGVLNGRIGIVLRRDGDRWTAGPLRCPAGLADGQRAARPGALPAAAGPRHRGARRRTHRPRDAAAVGRRDDAAHRLRAHGTPAPLAGPRHDDARARARGRRCRAATARRFAPRAASVPAAPRTAGARRPPRGRRDRTSQSTATTASSAAPAPAGRAAACRSPSGRS